MKNKKIYSAIAFAVLFVIYFSCAAIAEAAPKTKAKVDPEITALEDAAKTSFTKLQDRLKPGLRIALLPINAADKDKGNYAYNEMTIMFFDTLLYDMVERDQIDKILKEQNFQYSGLVDDRTAAQIGKFLGAQVIIIGDISGSGSTRRLVFRGLDVETAKIVAIAQERF